MSFISESLVLNLGFKTYYSLSELLFTYKFIIHLC